MEDLKMTSRCVGYDLNIVKLGLHAKESNHCLVTVGVSKATEK